MRNRGWLDVINAHLQELSRRAGPRLMQSVFRPTRAPERTLGRAGIRRILVCRNLHRLGDSITLTPLLEELATVFPHATVDVISGCPAARALYGCHRNVGSIVLLPAHVASHPLRTARVLESLRRRHYDLAIDPDLRSQSSRLLTLYAHAGCRLGFLGPHKSGALSHGVDAAGAPRHRAMTAVYLIRVALGEDPAQRAWPAPSLRLSDAEREYGRRTLARIAGIGESPVPPRCVGLFAGGTRGKALDPDWWRRFLATLEPRASPYRLLEILPPPGVSQLQDRYPGVYCPDVRKLAAILANLSLYVSADCGVMHLAWASGAPTVALFTVTERTEWGPWGARNRAITARDITPEQIALDIAKELDTAPAGGHSSIVCASGRVPVRPPS